MVVTFLTQPKKAQKKQLEYAYLFEKLLETLDIELIRINESVAKEAAHIRAQYTKFKAI